MLIIRLYSKDSCGLCEEVKKDLAALQSRFPHHLEEVDITEDTAVFEAYKHSIPVVKILGITLKAPITKADLVSSLSQELPPSPVRGA